MFIYGILGVVFLFVRFKIPLDFGDIVFDGLGALVLLVNRTKYSLNDSGLFALSH